MEKATPMKSTVLVVSLLLLAGCAGRPTLSADVTQSTRDRIALCNAGINVSLTAKVEGKIEENIRDGVKIDAGIENELRGLLLNSDKVDNNNVGSVYENYLKCVGTAA
jgi:type IV pilus biogenesis protein CpaD/CtpE